MALGGSLDQQAPYVASTSFPEGLPALAQVELVPECYRRFVRLALWVCVDQ